MPDEPLTRFPIDSFSTILAAARARSVRRIVREVLVVVSFTLADLHEPGKRASFVLVTQTERR
jgi:D-Tyr-tRNAtyr deacylase